MKPRTPIRKRRPGLRRGQPTPAEKAAIREMAYERAGGLCELVQGCGRGILPPEGDLFFKAHLVHLRGKRVHGWGSENVAIGCFEHHMASHNGKLTLPATYSELKKGL